MHIAAYILSCPEREDIRRQTVSNLGATDWHDQPIVEVDQTTFERRQQRQERTALRLLQRAVADGPERFLFLEDDLQFNLHLRHNLRNWRPLLQLRSGGHFFGSLYNPNVVELERHDDQAFFVANPNCVYGSQAFLLSLATGRYILTHWEEVPGMQDIKMSRLAARVCLIYYHTPSLVQHIGYQSAWGGPYHSTPDFSADWQAGDHVPD